MKEITTLPVAHCRFVIHKGRIFMCYRQNIYYCVRPAALQPFVRRTKKFGVLTEASSFKGCPFYY